MRFITLLGLAVVSAPVMGQMPIAGLPDAPSAVVAPMADGDGVGPSSSAEDALPEQQQLAVRTDAPLHPVAKPLAMVIGRGQRVQPLTVKRRFEMSIVKQLEPGEYGSAIASAAYGDWRDIRPHYGTDVAAFGQRVGAAYVRQTSQSVLYVGLFSSVLRQDPRYYIMGPGHRFFRRFGYAASRVVATRDEHGRRNAPNVSLWAGAVSAALLTDAYYPDADRDLPRAARSTLFTLLYRVPTQELKEFRPEMRKLFHQKPE